jgi:hypothetical protein
MEIPRHWRLKAQRYRLEGSACLVCGQHVFPPRPVCLDCSNQPVLIAGSALGRTALKNSIAEPGVVLGKQG